MIQKSVLLLITAGIVSAFAIPPLNALKLIVSYPDHLSHYLDGYIVWHDGTETLWDDEKEKTFDEMLDSADLQDQMIQVYPKATLPKEQVVNFDPGRIRVTSFFEKMYGGSEADINFNLVTVDWFGEQLMVTTVNGIDEKMRTIAQELKHREEYLHPSAGTYNFRPIAGTNRLSCHSFGIAIDISINFSRYWQWDKDWDTRSDHHSIPDAIMLDIIQVFERHGFIWGGRWYHYDSMHFEYRPELLL